MLDNGSDVFEIRISYESLAMISLEASNEELMRYIFEWEDEVDYNALEKVEIKNDAGELTGIFYKTNDGDKLGWQLNSGGGDIYHEYHFPDGVQRNIVISREGDIDSSSVRFIKVEDDTEDIRCNITFTGAELRENENVVKYVTSYRDGERHGLNVSGTYPVFDVGIYSEGSILESYKYKNGMIIEEMVYDYVGDDVFRNVWRYYDTGQLKMASRQYMAVKGNAGTFREDGEQRIYYESGIMSSSRNYKQGKLEGVSETYYEDGSLHVRTTYKAGVKDGEFEERFEDGTVQMKGTYKDGEEDGVWYAYMEDGKPISEIEYSEGILDGSYHIYATGELSYNSIHVIGQHEDGQKVGIWYYGYNNKGYTEKYLFENDIKVWKETGETRTYYNEDGSVSKTEKIS